MAKITLEWNFHPGETLPDVGLLLPRWVTMIKGVYYSVIHEALPKGPEIFHAKMCAAHIGYGYTTAKAAMDACVLTAGLSNAEHAWGTTLRGCPSAVDFSQPGEALEGTPDQIRRRRGHVADPAYIRPRRDSQGEPITWMREYKSCWS